MTPNLAGQTWHRGHLFCDHTLPSTPYPWLTVRPPCGSSAFRWKRFEIHDIMIQCAKVSLDPKEASCEEGYSSVPDPLPLHPLSRLRDSTVSPHPDHRHSYGQNHTHTHPLPYRISQPCFTHTHRYHTLTTRDGSSSCKAGMQGVILTPLFPVLNHTSARRHVQQD